MKSGGKGVSGEGGGGQVGTPSVKPSIFWLGKQKHKMPGLCLQHGDRASLLASAAQGNGGLKNRLWDGLDPKNRLYTSSLLPRSSWLVPVPQSQEPSFSAQLVCVPHSPKARVYNCRVQSAPGSTASSILSLCSFPRPHGTKVSRHYTSGFA